MRMGLPWLQLVLAHHAWAALGQEAAGTSSRQLEEYKELEAQAIQLLARFQALGAGHEAWPRRLQAVVEAGNGSTGFEDLPEEAVEMGEEEEEFTPVDIGASWTLTGSLVFTMIMFYFVNYPDDDIKRYTWTIISTTLSIFTAVMIFQGGDEVMLRLVIDPALGIFPEKSWLQMLRVVFGVLVFLSYFALAHLVVSYFAGVLCGSEGEGQLMERKWVVADAMRGDHGEAVDESLITSEGKSRGIATKNGVEVFVHSRLVVEELYERRTKCWAMLFAHMAGFAMISAGGDLQHAAPFVTNPALSWLAVVICAVFLLLLFQATSCLYKESSGSKNQSLYKEEGIDAEDDIFCLAISFLSVQSVRFTLSGSLPSKLGLYHEVEVEEHQMIGLYVSALVMLGAMTAAALLLHGGRRKDLVVGTLSMGFAWCVLFGTRAAFASLQLLQTSHISPATIEGRVLLAMTLSLFTCAVIVVLDRIEDAASREEAELHKLLKDIITGLSILIGFTWEHTFDGCVEAISSLWVDKLLGKCLLTVVILVIVVPAWRRYILSKVVDLHKAQHERREAMQRAGYSHQTTEGSSSEEDSTARLIC